MRYVGDDWLRFLGDQGIDFVVRLPIRYSKKHVKNYSSLQRKALRRKRAIATPVLWDGYNFQLVMRKNPDDCKDEPILYWMTSCQMRLQPVSSIVSDGKLRGAARAVFFKCLKTNGFNFQQMKGPGVPVQTSREDWVTPCCNRLCLCALSLRRHPAAQADQR